MPGVPTILKPKQQFVFETYLANPQYNGICMYGSSRSGKTFLTADYNHNRAVAYPGSFHLYVRATLTALTTGVITQTFPNLFRVYKNVTGVDFMNDRNEQGIKLVEHKANPYNRYSYYNGSEIRFVGLDKVQSDPSALDKILSTEYLTITIEEGPEMDWEVVEMLKTRLAQKVLHYKTGRPGVPKIIVTLNPRLFEDWDYVYFQKKYHPIDQVPLSEKVASRITSVHFELKDNEGNVSEDYLETLQGLSLSKQLRFLEGKHGDSFEGEIFKKIYWEQLPPLREFEQMIIYTDPSYKSGPKNDFKATVLIGKRQGAFWIIDGRAMQCTTAQMILNTHDIYHNIVAAGWNRPLPVWFENAGMPDDFEVACQTHALNHGWVVPAQLDNRDKGDKFARIETAVEPLNRTGKLFFNSALKSERFGNLTTVQMLNFRKHLLPTEHDDIPDAIHGGITMINMPTIAPGRTHLTQQLQGRPTF